MAQTNQLNVLPDEGGGVVDANEETLKDIKLFSALSKDQLAAVEKQCRWRLFAPHQQIIDRENTSRDVFFVIRGKVRIVNYSFSGRGITLDELYEGGYFGELSAIDSQPRSARVVSLTESLIGSMPQKYFLETLETYPKMALQVMTHLSQLLRGANQRIMDLSTLGANNRVHADLLRMIGELGIENGAAILDPVPVHNDIASRVSTTRETDATSQKRFGRFDAGLILSITAFLILPIALFVSKGVAPLFVLSVVLVLALSLGSGVRFSFPRSLSIVLAIFLLIAAMSALWSINPVSSLSSALRLALMCVGGLILAFAAGRLENQQRDFFENALIAGGVFGFSLILFENSSDWILTRALFRFIDVKESALLTLAPAFNAGMAICALYAWPWLLVVKRRYGLWPMVAALIVAVLAIFLSDAETPLVALLLGFVIATASIFFRRAVFGLLGVAMVVGVIGAPLLPLALPDPQVDTSRYPHFSHSALHRLSIWRTAAERISEKPVLGFGMNATRHLYNNSDKSIRAFNTSVAGEKSWYNNFEPIPLHTHNGVLQIWLELGGLGALALLAVLLAVLNLIYRTLENKVDAAASLGLLTSGLFIFSSSFGPWQSWWQGGLWLSTAFVIAALGGVKPKRP